MVSNLGGTKKMRGLMQIKEKTNSCVYHNLSNPQLAQRCNSYIGKTLAPWMENVSTSDSLCKEGVLL